MDKHFSKEKSNKKEKMAWASPMSYFMGVSPLGKRYGLRPLVILAGLLGMATIAYFGGFVWTESKYGLFLHYQLTTSSSILFFAFTGTDIGEYLTRHLIGDMTLGQLIKLI